jgi:acyl carrier protein
MKMEKETIKNKVFEIIESKRYHKGQPLTMESKLEDDLWMDSLDEKEFGISIPDDDPGRCLTVKDVVDYIIRRMKE